MFQRLRQWLAAPGYEFSDLFLCLHCERVYVGRGHWHCGGLAGPRLVPLADGLRKDLNRIRALRGVIEKLGNKEQEPYPGAADGALSEDRYSHIMALSDFRQEPQPFKPTALWRKRQEAKRGKE